MSEQLTGRVGKTISGYISTRRPDRGRFHFRVEEPLEPGALVTFEVEPATKPGQLPRAVNIKPVEEECSP